MKPRVLFVDQSGALGGAELSLADIVKHFSDGCKVTLLSDGSFRVLLEQMNVPATVISIPRILTKINREHGGIREFAALPAIITLSYRLARLATDYDLIYGNTQKAMIIAAVAGRLSGKPVIWHLRDILSADHFGRTRRWAAVHLANFLVSRIIANSQATADAFAAAGGDPARVTVIYNGIDPGAFTRVAGGRPMQLRASLGLVGGPLVGVFGRLSPWKGQHVLIDALARLPGVHALIVGAALYGEQAYADDLQGRLRAMNLADRIHFLGFRSDIPDLMALCDIVVHTSVAPEPFGRVLVEGMLARRPVVAARAGGVPEIIEDGISGVLVPPGDSRALAEALVCLLNDRSRAARLAANGCERAHRHFSLDAMLERIEQEIASVLARSSSLAQPSEPVDATPTNVG